MPTAEGRKAENMAEAQSNERSRQAGLRPTWSANRKLDKPE